MKPLAVHVQTGKIVYFLWFRIITSWLNMLLMHISCELGFCITFVILSVLPLLFLQVSFEDKKKELFEMVLHLKISRLTVVFVFFSLSIQNLRFWSSLQVSIPTWFTMDTRLGSLSIHLDAPQCFSAEMYAADLNIPGAPEDLKVIVFCVLAFGNVILSRNPINSNLRS